MKTLYYNGDFVPMTGEGDTFEALLVADDGTIAAVGDYAELKERMDGAQEVDLKGATVCPGFIDPHSHFSGTTQYLTTVDLSFCESFEDIKQTMLRFMEERHVDSDGVIMGTGYDQNALVEGRHPDKSLLDQVSLDIPVVAMHASSHMAVANSKMLELAGITNDTPDPEGGHYGRSEDTGELTGYAEEPAALFPLFGIVQPRLKMDLPAMFPEMQRFYLEQGVTTCQDGATQEDFAQLFAHMAKAGQIKLDVVAYPMYGRDVKGMLDQGAEFVGQDYVGHYRIGGVKMFVDGSPQGRTAWMTEPYTPGEDGKEDYCGFGTMTDEEALDFALFALDGNYQLLCHCNGDAAADQYLRIYREALTKTSNPDAGKLRPVMIHCQCTRTDQYEAMAEINMIPSIFVSHVWYWGDVHIRNFGPERGSRISAARDALDNGLPFTFHSDTPVLKPNALESIWCAVNRVTKKGRQLDESQKVSAYEALRAVTANGAYQYGEEERKGTLEPGKLADLVILDKNPCKVDPMDIRDIKVLETVKEGESVYRRR